MCRESRHDNHDFKGEAIASQNGPLSEDKMRAVDAAIKYALGLE